MMVTLWLCDGHPLEQASLRGQKERRRPPSGDAPTQAGKEDMHLLLLAQIVGPATIKTCAAILLLLIGGSF